VQYDPRLRPAQQTPAFDAFTACRETVRDGIGISFLHEGVGGYPLLLLHGYPETKRIWWRNIAPLAAAGFEVIAPDLRGYGDSDLSPDGAYDLTIYSRDIHALVQDVLGHDRCAVVAGDIGGVVAIDLAQRFAGFVERLCYFTTQCAEGRQATIRNCKGLVPKNWPRCWRHHRPAGNGSQRCTRAGCGHRRARSRVSRWTS
jgi:pimeloyl-ACP methyl ester carboxylesterase